MREGNPPPEDELLDDELLELLLDELLELELLELLLDELELVVHGPTSSQA